MAVDQQESHGWSVKGSRFPNIDNGFGADGRSTKFQALNFRQTSTDTLQYRTDAVVSDSVIGAPFGFGVSDLGVFDVHCCATLTRDVRGMVHSSRGKGIWPG